jgi:hypothetical protein
MEGAAHPRREFRLEPTIRDGQPVKIIGAGGVGGIVARYACLMLDSLARNLGLSVRVVIVDGDAFQPGNGSRMFFLRHGNKADVVREEIRPYLGSDTPLTLISISEYITPENIDRLIVERDIVLCAVDNHATRRLLDERCGLLHDVCLISAGNDGVGPDSSGSVRRGTFGNCQIYLRRKGQDLTPSLCRDHPEIREPADRLPSEQSCGELVSCVPQILAVNLMTAATILNTFWLFLAGRVGYGELVFDVAEGLMRPIPLPGHRPDCRENTL